MFQTRESRFNPDIESLVERVADLASKGYFLYVVGLGPERDMTEFDDEFRRQLEEVRRESAIAHPLEDFECLRHGRQYVIMLTTGLRDYFGQYFDRIGDVRQSHVPCWGFALACRKIGEGYFVVVSHEGKTLDVFTRKVES